MTLEGEIKKVDAQYDLCNEAWARGEADKFATEELLDLLDSNPSPVTRYGGDENHVPTKSFLNH